MLLNRSEMLCFSLIAAQNQLSCYCLISVNMKHIIPPNCFFNTGWCCSGRGQTRCTPCFNQRGKLFANRRSRCKVSWRCLVVGVETSFQGRWVLLSQTRTIHSKACLRSAAMHLQTSETSLLWNREHSGHAKYCLKALEKRVKMRCSVCARQLCCRLEEFSPGCFSPHGCWQAARLWTIPGPQML